MIVVPKRQMVQVVLIPILVADEVKNELVLTKLKDMQEQLRKAGVRTQLDDRRHVRHGQKYFEWERRGVPLRVELGMRDIQSHSCVLALRVERLVNGQTTSKLKIPMEPTAFADAVVTQLSVFQSDLLERARERLQSRTRSIFSYEEMKNHMTDASSDVTENAGLYLAPWHEDDVNEAAIKAECKATIRCYPAPQNSDPKELKDLKCFYSGRPATHMALFGRAY
jgi:prolyl-tRNA synthetase